MKKYIILLGIIIAMSFAVNALAQVPGTILYQGKLTNADGASITTSVSVTLAIYSVPTGGTALYTVTSNITPDGNGVFTRELGPFAATVFNGSERYLGIKVGTDAEMQPRQKIASTPYAMLSTSAGMAHAFNSGSVNLETSATLLDSVVIEAPMPGYIAIHASGSTSMTHPGTGSGYINIGIGTNSALFDYDNQCYIYIGVQPAGTYYYPISNVVGFTVPAAGTYKYYLLGFRGAGLTSASVYRTHILATFYPTAYGVIDVSKTGTSFGPNPEDVSQDAGE